MIYWWFHFLGSSSYINLTQSDIDNEQLYCYYCHYLEMKKESSKNMFVLFLFFNFLMSMSRSVICLSHLKNIMTTLIQTAGLSRLLNVLLYYKNYFLLLSVLLRKVCLIPSYTVHDIATLGACTSTRGPGNIEMVLRYFLRC
jgi:hypothetical protein